jgi:hypothetical protein
VRRELCQETHPENGQLCHLDTGHDGQHVTYDVEGKEYVWRNKCGDRTLRGHFVWECNLEKGHEGRHTYRTPNGESQVHWEKVPMQ